MNEEEVNMYPVCEYGMCDMSVSLWVCESVSLWVWHVPSLFEMCWTITVFRAGYWDYQVFISIYENICVDDKRV